MASPWPSKLGPETDHPGFSPHAAPEKLYEECPWFSLSLGGPTTPVLDPDGSVWVTKDGSLMKLDQGGTIRMVCAPPANQSGFHVTPAILNGAILTANAEGTACSFSTASGKRNWQSRFCEGCGQDPWSVAVARGCVCMPGKNTSNPAVRWNDHVFLLGASMGDVRWKFQIAGVVIHFTASIVQDALVFADMQCAVHCLSVRHGSVRWEAKPESAGCRSTGGAVATGDGWVYHAGNRRGKKLWNAAFGGQGLVRAFELKTGKQHWAVPLDLEANTTPAVLPCGPQGKTIVVVALGASPGDMEPVAPPIGDCWEPGVVALDAATGAVVWLIRNPGFMWKSEVARGWRPDRLVQPTALSNPAGSSNGCVYCGFMSGHVFVIRGATGDVEAVEDMCFSAIQATPVIGPGVIYVASFDVLTCWRLDAPPVGKVLQPLERPFAESGTRHFWPGKTGDMEHTCYTGHVGPADLSKPAWSFECLDRNLGDFFYNSPVIDAQRNIYVSSNHRDLHVIRPDGSLRGSIYLRSMVRTPYLVGRTGYTTQFNGYCISFDLETLQENWVKRFCRHVNADSGSVTATEEHIIAYGNPDSDRDGALTLFNLKPENGDIRWEFNVTGGLIYNSMPSIVDGLVVTCANMGGIFCLNLEDGSLVWQAESTGHFGTGHHNVAPNGLVYMVSHAMDEKKWNCGCSGGHGLIRAFDVRTGSMKWRRDFDLELQVTNVAIPRPGDSGGYVLVAPLGNNPGFPSPGAAGDHWEARLTGLDAGTGDELWFFTPPPLRFNSCVGNAAGDVYLPDAWGSLTADGRGTVYGGFVNGFIYAVDGHTGQLLSQYDMKNTCNCACAIAPGMVVCMSALRVYCWRDEAAESRWVASAAGEGDPRAFALTPAADPPEASLRGVLRDVHAHAFNCEDLRPFEWSSQFFQQEPARRRAEITLTEKEQQDELARLAAGPPTDEGSGGAAPKAPAAPVAGGAQEPPGDGDQRWKVVGGGKEGGIKVRRGESLRSQELPSRLSTGAVVEESERVGDRLHYKKVSGDGPDFGWVSLSFKGVALLEKCS